MALAATGFRAIAATLLGSGFLEGPGGWIISALGPVLILLVSGPLFVLFSGVLAPFFWDGIGREAELAAVGEVVEHPLSRRAFLLDMALRLGFMAMVSVPATILIFTPALWLSPVLLGLLIFSDVTGSVMQRRGVPFPRALGQAFRPRSAWALLAACIGLSFFSVLLAAMLPVLAASASLMFAEDRHVP